MEVPGGVGDLRLVGLKLVFLIVFRAVSVLGLSRIYGAPQCSECS